MEVRFTVENQAKKNYKRLLQTAGSNEQLLRRALAVFDLIQEVQSTGATVIIKRGDNVEKLRDVWD